MKTWRIRGYLKISMKIFIWLQLQMKNLHPKLHLNSIQTCLLQLKEPIKQMALLRLIETKTIFNQNHLTWKYDTERKKLHLQSKMMVQRKLFLKEENERPNKFASKKLLLGELEKYPCTQKWSFRFHNNYRLKQYKSCKLQNFTCFFDNEDFFKEKKQ